MPLRGIRRTSVHGYLIIWLKHETTLAVFDETVLYRKAEKLGYLGAGLERFWIMYPAGDVHPGGRSSVLETAGDEDEVLDRGVLGERIYSRS